MAAPAKHIDFWRGDWEALSGWGVASHSQPSPHERSLFSRDKDTATSIADQIIGELQEARDFVQAEGERVQREAEHYITLTQVASASVKIISDTVAGWREAGHPLPNNWTSSQFGVLPSLTETITGSVRVPDHHVRSNRSFSG